MEFDSLVIVRRRLREIINSAQASISGENLIKRVLYSWRLGKRLCLPHIL
jgi:hypothetical protein